MNLFQVEGCNVYLNNFVKSFIFRFNRNVSIVYLILLLFVWWSSSISILVKEILIILINVRETSLQLYLWLLCYRSTFAEATVRSLTYIFIIFESVPHRSDMYRALQLEWLVDRWPTNLHFHCDRHVQG